MITEFRILHARGINPAAQIFLDELFVGPAIRSYSGINLSV